MSYTYCQVVLYTLILTINYPHLLDQDIRLKAGVTVRKGMFAPPQASVFVQLYVLISYGSLEIYHFSLSTLFIASTFFAKPYSRSMLDYQFQMIKEVLSARMKVHIFHTSLHIGTIFQRHPRNVVNFVQQSSIPLLHSM